MPSKRTTNYVNAAVQTIGARIREVRGTLDQKDFGEKFNLTRRQVSSYERNETLPQVTFIEALAGNQQLDIGWLISGKGSKHKSNQISVKKESLSRKTTLWRETSFLLFQETIWFVVQVEQGNPLQLPT